MLFVQEQGTGPAACVLAQAMIRNGGERGRHKGGYSITILLEHVAGPVPFFVRARRTDGPASWSRLAALPLLSACLLAARHGKDSCHVQALEY